MYCGKRVRAVSIIDRSGMNQLKESVILCWIPEKSAAVRRQNAHGIRRRKNMDLEEKAVLRLQEGVTEDDDG